MAVSLSGLTLTLTGGSTGARLGPANFINDATAFSTGSTYAVNALVKHNAGGGLGTALYRCSTAVTVAGAFNASNWTLMVFVQGSNNIWFSNSAIVSAAYNDTAWAYNFAAGFIFAGTGCDWLSGSAVNGLKLMGFSMVYPGTGLTAGLNNMLTGASGVISWANVRVLSPAGVNVGVNLENQAMTGYIENGFFAWGDNNAVNIPLIVQTNMSFLRANLTINPTNLTGLSHTGLWDFAPSNKIGVITATASATVVTATKYIVSALGTATLAQWQALFSTLTAIPAVGDLITSTSAGTLAGSATVKTYRALNKYAPDIPANLSRNIGIIGQDLYQYFEDIVVPTGFNFATMIEAFYGNSSVYFTRLVNITAKQGSSLLADVFVRVVNLSNNSQLSIETTDANGNIRKQMQIFFGNRVGGGSYIALQNQVDWRNKSFLLRRKDLIEASFSQDMTISGVEFTQFMQTDPYYTTDQSANTTIALNSGTKTITLTGANTVDQLYDYVKYWLSQNMSVASFISGSGTVCNLTDWLVVGAQHLTVGTKLTSIQSTGSVTAVGALGVSITGNVTQATPTNLTGVTITGNLTFNTNTPITVTFTNITVSGTVSNSGTGLVTILLANSTVGTVGSNVATQLVTALSITSLLADSQIYVSDNTGTQVAYVSSSGTSYNLDTTGGTGTWEWRVRKYGYEDQSGTFTPATSSESVVGAYLTDSFVVDTLVNVTAYTDLQTTQKIYDYSRYFATTNTGIALAAQFDKGFGTLIANSAFTLNPSAGALMAVAGGIVTTKTSGLAESVTVVVTGNFTQGAATLSNDVKIRATNLDSELLFSSIDSLTVYATQSDALNNTSPGATSTTGIIRFLYGAALSGVTMSGTVYLRLTLGTAIQVQSLVLVLGENEVNLSTTTLLQSINTKVDNVPTEVLAATVETNTSLAESLRLSNSVLGGKVSGASTSTETFRDINDTKNRVVADVDSNGNRTAITLDLS